MNEGIKCPLCSARFATATDLAAHLKTHEQPLLPDSLEQQFKEEAEKRRRRSPIWNWSDDGPDFIGRILDIREVTTENRTWKAVECRMLDGSIKTLAVGPKILTRLFEEKNPKIGDVIAVRNLGKPKGKRYYDFLMVVNPEGVDIPEEAGKK